MRPRVRRGEGVVATYDDHVGVGSVRSADGVEIGFHCTAIADDTRSIEVGTPVTYDVVPGHLGHYEATGVRAYGPLP